MSILVPNHVFQFPTYIPVPNIVLSIKQDPI
jgi:hypothetical protein